MEKKQLVQLLLAVFIAVIFLSSYLTLENLNTAGQGSHQSKPAPVPQTVYGVGAANAVITGYNSTMTILINCKNSSSSGSASAALNNLVSEMEKNNTIYNSYSLQNETVVQAGNAGSKAIYSAISKSLNATTLSCLTFSSYAELYLPGQMQLYIVNKTYTVLVPQNLSRVQIPMALSSNTPTTVKVKVSALVEFNGTVYSLNVTGPE